MNSLLDRSFTLSVRQIWRWTRRAIYVLIPVYIFCLFANEWALRYGGVGLSTSPIKELVPERCTRFVDGRSRMTPGGRTLLDVLLLRERVRRTNATFLVSSNSITAPCFGFAIAGGLHAETPHEANFTDQWIDEMGDPVVTVQVKYHKHFSVTKVERETK